jgi:hypothetical protein
VRRDLCPHAASIGNAAVGTKHNFFQGICQNAGCGAIE